MGGFEDDRPTSQTVATRRINIAAPLQSKNGCLETPDVTVYVYFLTFASGEWEVVLPYAGVN